MEDGTKRISSSPAPSVSEFSFSFASSSAVTRSSVDISERNDVPESIRTVVRALHDGCSATDAVESLRLVDKGDRMRPSQSLSTAISYVKRVYMEAGVRDPEYESTLETFLTVVERDGDNICKTRAAEFAGEKLKTQYRVWKRYQKETSSRSRVKMLFGKPSIDEAFRNIRLVPENVLKMRMDRAERKEDDKYKEPHVLVIRDAGSLLARFRAILSEAKTATNSSLTIALMGVCGRKMVDVLNPRTMFVEDPRTGPDAYACRFRSGQRKDSCADTPEDRDPCDGWMVIPLLVPLSLFTQALSLLRAKQGPDVWEKTNKQFGNYSGNLIDCIHNKFVELPEGATPYMLRVIYAAMVFEAFECGDVFARVVQRIFGVVTLKETVHLSNIRLKKFADFENSLGVLPNLDPPSSC